MVLRGMPPGHSDPKFQAKKFHITSSKRYKILIQKAYFEKGNSLFSIAKYAFIAPFLSSMNEGLMSLLAYMIISWLVGMFWYSRRFGLSLQEIESEVGNQFNRFQQEMREFTKSGTFPAYASADPETE